MTHSDPLRHLLEQLTPQVEDTGAWERIETRAQKRRWPPRLRWPFAARVETGPRDQMQAPTSRRRSGLRIAVFASIALVLAAAAAVGGVFAIRHLGEPHFVLWIDHTDMGTVSEASTTAPTATAAGSGHWVQLSLPSNGGEITALVMDPSDPSVLYMGMPGGLLFKSSDGAESWHQLPVSGSDGYLVAFDPASSSTVYVLTWERSGLDGFAILSRSDDGGATWTDLSGAVQISGPPFPAGTLVLPNGLDDPDVMWLDTASSSSTVYISTIHEPTDDTADKATQVWRSTDRGESWTQLSPQEATNAVAQRQQARLGTDFAGTLTDADTGAVLGVYLGRIDPSDPAIRYAATDHGVYKSTDGGTTWKKASTGLVVSPVLGVVPDPSSPSILYAATPEGIVKSGDAGASWDLILAGQGSLVLAPSAPSTLYAWTSAGLLFRTDDGGVNWTRLTGAGLVGTLSAPSDADGELVLVAADNPDTVFALAGPLLFRSTDGGNTWNQVLEGLTAFAADPQDPSTLFAATATGETNKEVYQVLKSTDAGGTWTVVSSQPFVHRLGDIAIDARTPANVYVVERGGAGDYDFGAWPNAIFRSPDDGATWEKVDLIDFQGLKATGWGLPSTPMRLLFDPRSPDTLYAIVMGTTGWTFGATVCRSTDGGTTWQNLVQGSDREGGVNASTVVIDPAPGGGLYSTSEAGLFKWVPPGN
jgi:photosystem II stability/assembly factor-like uncharacterized protein